MLFRLGEYHTQIGFEAIANASEDDQLTNVAEAVSQLMLSAVLAILIQSALF